MDLEIPKEKQICETEEYRIFSEDIDFLIEFFTELSELVYFNGRTISFFSDKEITTLEMGLIDSFAQTIKSIKLCSSIGSFSDANTLIRKLRDDLIQFVYILNIINLRKPFSEESIKDLKSESIENLSSSLLNLQFNNILTEDEQAVNAWFKNKVSDLPRTIKKKLEFENYMKVLIKNEKISHLITEYNLKEYWDNLRKRLNNYVHTNGTIFLSHNYISTFDKNLGTHLKNINLRTSYITSFFLVLLLMIESSLISSTDYIDHLDGDMEPPKDSQYLVAGFVQDFIDKKVSKLHPELKQYLKDNNIQGMKIE